MAMMNAMNEATGRIVGRNEAEISLETDFCEDSSLLARKVGNVRYSHYDVHWRIDPCPSPCHAHGPSPQPALEGTRIRYCCLLHAHGTESADHTHNPADHGSRRQKVQWPQGWYWWCDSRGRRAREARSDRDSRNPRVWMTMVHRDYDHDHETHFSYYDHHSTKKRGPYREIVIAIETDRPRPSHSPSPNRYQVGGTARAGTLTLIVAKHPHH